MFKIKYTTVKTIIIARQIIIPSLRSLGYLNFLPQLQQLQQHIQNKPQQHIIDRIKGIMANNDLIAKLVTYLPASCFLGSIRSSKPSVLLFPVYLST